MLVRIQLRQGRKVARKSGKNRNVAYTFAALLKPVALLAYVLSIWRLASDIGMTSEFAFSGTFSHWQVWVGVGAFVHLISSVLARYGSGGELRLPKVFSLGSRPAKPEQQPIPETRAAAGR